ncbi:hypothetical protein D3C81_1304280 [compost metagenome]
MENVNSLLAKYKSLIDFSDQTQRNNYKTVESYIRYLKKKDSEEEIVWFIQKTIDLHMVTLYRR